MTRFKNTHNLKSWKKNRKYLKFQKSKKFFFDQKKKNFFFFFCYLIIVTGSELVHGAYTWRMTCHWWLGKKFLFLLKYEPNLIRNSLVCEFSGKNHQFSRPGYGGWKNEKNFEFFFFRFFGTQRLLEHYIKFFGGMSGTITTPKQKM